MTWLLLFWKHSSKKEAKVIISEIIETSGIKKLDSNF